MNRSYFALALFISLAPLGLYMLTADKRFLDLASHLMAFICGAAVTELMP